MNTAVEVQDFLSGLTAERDRYKAQAAKDSAVAKRAVADASAARAELTAKLTEVSTVLAAVIHETTHGGLSIGALVRTSVVRSHVLAVMESGLEGVNGSDNALCKLVDDGAPEDDTPELREVLLTGGVRLCVALTAAELLSFRSWIGRK